MTERLRTACVGVVVWSWAFASAAQVPDSPLPPADFHGEGVSGRRVDLAAGTFWRNTYLQTQLKLEIPWRRPQDNRELVYNIYVGRDLAVTPDAWTIGAELNGENDEVALTPQLRKGVTRTGALAVALGVRVPLINREEQHTQWVGYLLWEFLEPVRARR